MARIPVNLPNGRSWSRKGDAEQHFKDMLGRYAVGGRVLDEADHDDLLTLLSLYDKDLPPGRPTKSGSGVAYFEKGIDTDRPFKSQCFFVIRRDGSKIDFSVYEALKSAVKVS